MTTAKTINTTPISTFVAPMPARPKVAVKPAAKKASAGRTQVRKSSAKKASVEKTAVKKAVVKTPLSKAFAPTQKTKITKLVKSAKTSKAVKAVKPEKPRKPKLVRDSFTIPKNEYVVLETLKKRANQLKKPIKKSELLRAGIKALAALADTAFLNALDKVPTIKTGRPSSGS